MLTPLDIESKVFRKTMIGFSTGEVKHFISEILANYEKIYKENVELRDKINVLNEGIGYYKTLEETLKNTLVLAERTAEETKNQAYIKAEQIEKEAELKAEQIVSQARQEVFKINQRKESLVKDYDASVIQIKQFLRAQLEMVEKNTIEINSPELVPNVTHIAYEEAVVTDENIMLNENEE